ncbi:hypothetical protein EXE30_03780 [Acinetobacter halotolerans]|uniref:DUF7944 domain-containing protein n=1 Tax=Acinetobacter halotolerans TaxID=1752076 RepID=A0A4Q6XJJ8_9GAMM|nr:hypothetical protein [Acinetobacter halotolerans]RZF55935.1 hypothetical protein EXE30_03780 [Acinetobacter halotolerans]
MKKNVFKTLGLSLLIASSALTPVAYAANAKQESENIEVTPMTQTTTQEELAAIYVLSEICPSLIDEDKKFTQGYDRLVKEYLPKESKAVDVLNKRAKAKDFQKFLVEARKDAKAASDEKNRQICEDVRNYK